MKKEIITILVCIFMAAGIFGCDSANKSEVPAFADKEWIRVAETGEEHLLLGSDLSWSYYEASSGNPVDDADLFETYQYNVKNETITLEGHGEERVYHVVSYDDASLILEINGEERTFLSK